MSKLDGAPSIVLFSSNARIQYFDDCLKALMLPRGMILHFRYRCKYIAPGLLAKFKSKTVLGANVMVCYVLQTLSGAGATFKPERIRPIRSGTIVDVEIVGPTAHIYFAVGDYPRGADAALEIARRIERHGIVEQTYFAAEVSGLRCSQFSTEATDAAAFTAIVDAFDESDLRIPVDGGGFVDCDPLFMRVAGVFARSKGKPSRIQPTSARPFSDRERGYVIPTHAPLELRTQFYQPRWSKLPSRGITVHVKADNANFVASKDRFDIDSPYDQTEIQFFQRAASRPFVSRIELVPVPRHEDTQREIERMQPFQAIVARNEAGGGSFRPPLGFFAAVIAVIAAALSWGKSRRKKC